VDDSPGKAIDYSIVPEIPDSQLSTFNIQLSALKTIPALNVDSALEAMSGLQDVYLDTVKLTVRLLPERIDKMNRFIDSDIKSFTVEVHGLKSVLKNIGASALGNLCALFENAALDRDFAYCKEQYPPFRTALAELADYLSAALPDRSVKSGEPADKALLAQAVIDTIVAAENYDRDNALDIILPFLDYTYNMEADELLKKIVFALESFNCDSALEYLAKLSSILTR
jgi:HPt (histidine-containing phosphotransfer) domain-containing protein